MKNKEDAVFNFFQAYKNINKKYKTMKVKYKLNITDTAFCVFPLTFILFTSLLPGPNYYFEFGVSHACF